MYEQSITYDKGKREEGRETYTKLVMFIYCPL